MTETPSRSEASISRSDERRAFVTLAVFLAAVLAVLVVGGYGFIIWMSQLFVGPPDPDVDVSCE